MWASTRHKGLITHKFADLRRSRNVNMKYENEDGGNKSDVRGSVGSFMKASIIVLDGLLCLVAAVESHFALSPLASLSLPPPISPRLSFAILFISLFLSTSFSLLSTRTAPPLLCPAFSSETSTGTSARFAREFGSLTARRHFVLPFVAVVLIHGS